MKSLKYKHEKSKEKIKTNLKTKYLKINEPNQALNHK